MVHRLEMLIRWSHGISTANITYLCIYAVNVEKVVSLVYLFPAFDRWSSSDSLFAAGAPLSLGMLTITMLAEKRAPIGDREVY